MGLRTFLYRNKINSIKKDLSSIVQYYDTRLSKFIKDVKRIELVVDMPPATAACYDPSKKKTYIDKSTIDDILKTRSNIEKIKNSSLEKQLIRPLTSRYLYNMKKILHELIHAYRHNRHEKSSNSPYPTSYYLEEVIAEALSTAILYEDPKMIRDLLNTLENSISKDIYMMLLDLSISQVELELNSSLLDGVTLDDYNELLTKKQQLIDKKKAYEKGYIDGLKLAYYLSKLQREEKKERIKNLLYANSMKDIEGILREAKIL